MKNYLVGFIQGSLFGLILGTSLALGFDDSMIAASIFLSIFIFITYQWLYRRKHEPRIRRV
jgi:hypothetical protein